MADTPKKTTPSTDDTQATQGAASNIPTPVAGSAPTIDAEAGVTMGDGIHHLHSLAKGDEDYINGDTHKDDSAAKPEQDKL